MSAHGASHNELDLLRDYHNNESRVYVTYVTVKWRHVRNRQAILLCAKGIWQPPRFGTEREVFGKYFPDGCEPSRR